jgi:nitrate/TMAO reductase-like tetraheme cytochrome c subunit
MGKKKTRQLKKNQYECEACHGIFEKGWSDEEAKDEFAELFPDVALQDTGLVCEACHIKISAYFGYNIKRS